MNRQLRRTTLAATLFLLAVSGCSGGGGGGGGGNGGGGGAPAGPTLFQLSGSIEVASGTAVDGDVNDTTAPFTPNNTLAAAQVIPNPVTVGGYVNRPGAGAPGRSFAAGDDRDYYRISIAAGQSIRLSIASDGLFDDIDIALLDLGGTELAASDGITPIEEITAATSGDFIIEVLAVSGASNYVLTVGQSLAVQNVPAEPDFVPGDVIVRFRDTTLGATTASRMAGAGIPMRRLADRRAAALYRSRGSGELGVAFRSLDAMHLYDDPVMHRLPEPQFMRRATRRLAKVLRRRGDVLSADLNYLRQPTAVPSDEFFALQWHLPLINLVPAWDNVAPASGVVVAVIDTGVIPNHPDLQGQLVDGYDFIQDPAISLDGHGCDGDPTDVGDGPTPSTSSFHGTHVAGTVAARTSLQPGGDNVGVAGVAWNARVMPLRVLGFGGGTDFDLIQALRYAAGLSNACGVLPSSPADVINLSLGGPAESSAVQAAIDAVRAAGVTVVAAAGNDSTNAPFYPASHSGVISVSAVDQTSQLTSYSNFGTTIDVTAPGGDLSADLDGDGYGDGVLSTLYAPEGGSNGFVYGFSAGTSMAAPHVAGVIALMLGVNPALTPADIDALLAAGDLTQDLGTPLFFGHGLIDAFAAVSAAFVAQGGTPPVNDPRLESDPAAANLGGLLTVVEIEVANAGGDQPPLVVQGYSVATDDGAAWLSLVPISVDANGLGRYQVRIDRSMVAQDGTYTGTVSFDSSANDLDVPVIMQVGGPIGDDAGRHFVLLLDAVTLETVREFAVLASNGTYSYSFSDVEAGEYLLVAGTDSDNDVLICDPGEACGAYPTLDQRVAIDLDRDRAGVDFDTGFGGQLGAAAVGGPQGGYSRAVAGQAQEAEPAPAPRVLVVTPFGVVEGDEGPVKGLVRLP